MPDQQEEGLEPTDAPAIITSADVPPSDATAPAEPDPSQTRKDSPDAADEPATPPPAPPAARSRTGAVWVGIFVGALLLIALIIFLLQNTDEVEVHFLGWTGTAPLAVALLIAGVGVGLIAVVVGTLRIAQLRRRLGVARKAAATPR